MIKRFIMFFAAVLIPLTAFAAGEMFDFYIPWNDSSANAIDLSSFISRDVDAEGYLRATADGHLALNSGRIRFWGTNLTFSAAFPAKSYAPDLAAHFAKYGINMVRFHHMDMFASTEGIWRTTSYDRQIDDTQRDKLEYMVYQLKQKGVYSDINLLVSRPFNSLTDLPADINTVTDWKVRAALSFFDPQLQQLQKDYAQSLLTHVSPYTGLTFAQDPAIGFIEINNENGLIQAYLSNQINALPPFYNNELQAQWNAWLKAKYAANAAMTTAWGVMNTPAGAEKLLNNDFSSGAIGPSWSLQVMTTAAGSAAVTADGAGTGSVNSAKITITTAEPANAWHVQFMQAGLSVQTGKAYTFSFWAKSDSNRAMDINIMNNANPWNNLGFASSVNLTSAWQKFTFVTSVNTTVTTARITFSSLASAAGNIWITGASFKEGGTLGLYPGEDLDTDSVLNFVNTGGTIARTDEAKRDWLRFLRDTELNYWTTLRDYIKNTLGAKALIFGTIVGCTTPNLAAIFDVVDTHTYWQHPSFPGVSWSGTDWYQANVDMANTMSGTTVGNIAVKRVLNKPLAVTEYNHASPNTYAADGFYFLSAYGGLQDWDAVFSFDYGGGNGGWDIKKTEGYFAVGQNPAKMGSFIPAALSFIRGDIAPASQQIVASLTNEDEIEGLLTSWAWRLVDGTTAGMDERESFVHRTAIAVEGQSVPGGSLSPGASIPGNIAVSDTNQVKWDLSTAGKGVITADTGMSKFIYGFIGGNTYLMSGGVTITAGATLQNGFGTLAISAINGASIASATKIVVTACGAYQNTNQIFYTYPSTVSAFPPAYGINLTSRDQWGTYPSRIEGIPAVITLPIPYAYVSVWSLGSTGDRVSSVAVTNSGGFAQFSIAPSYSAMWYEVVVNNPSFSPTFTKTQTPNWTATPTFTPTQTATLPTCDTVDDCENLGTSQDLWGGWWYTYRDSLGTVSSGAKRAGGSPPSPGGCFYSSGTFTAGGYCGIGANLSSGVYVNLSSYQFISLYVKGDGKQYDLRISTKGFIDAAANNYYQYTFTAPAAWTLIQAPLSSFTQPGGTARPFDLNQAKDLLWAADQSYSIYLDDVQFCRQLPTMTNTPTPVSTDTNTPTKTATATFTKTATDTISVTYTRTYTITETDTVSPTATETITGTPPTETMTPSMTLTATETVSYTATDTYTATPSGTGTSTHTPTLTRTATNTSTRTATSTRTRTATPTLTRTPQPTATVSVTPTATVAQITGEDLPKQKPVPYPNPFNPDKDAQLNLSFSTSKDMSSGRLRVFTSSFRLVAEAAFIETGAGEHIVSVPSNRLKFLANGPYYFTVEAAYQNAANETSRAEVLLIAR